MAMALDDPEDAENDDTLAELQKKHIFASTFSTERKRERKKRDGRFFLVGRLVGDVNI